MYSTPKTNWEPTDKFNIEDYNRIKNNIQYLKDFSLNLYSSYTTVDMGADATYNDIPYADMINALEDNLQTISTNTYNLEIGVKKTYGDNSVFIDYVELNRLEIGCKALYGYLIGQYNGRSRLPFKFKTKGGF